MLPQPPAASASQVSWEHDSFYLQSYQIVLKCPHLVAKRMRHAADEFGGKQSLQTGREDADVGVPTQC